MPNQRKTRLSGLDISMISMVAAGDDPMAKIVLSKAAPEDKNDNRSHEPSTITRKTKGVAMPKRSDVITKDELPDEVVAYIDALEDEVDRLTKAEDDDDAGDGDDGTNDTDADDSDDAGDSDSDADDTSKSIAKALAKADPEVRELIEKQERRIAAAEAVAKAERDERLRRDFVAKAQALPMISEKPDDLGGLLKSIHDLDPKVAGQVEKILKAANEQIASSNLFGEVGKSGASTTVSASLDSAAREIMSKSSDMTYEQAVVEALSANPALYDEYSKEG